MFWRCVCENIPFLFRPYKDTNPLNMVIFNITFLTESHLTDKIADYLRNVMIEQLGVDKSRLSLARVSEMQGSPIRPTDPASLALQIRCETLEEAQTLEHGKAADALKAYTRAFGAEALTFTSVSEILPL